MTNHHTDPSFYIRYDSPFLIYELCWRTEGGGGSYGGSRFDGGSRGGDRSRGESDLVMQEDTIFVSGMPDDASEDDVKDHFGSIGVIKVRKCELLAVR